jgi:hypothetical protein
MFVCEREEKIFQTLPGQGWQVLVEWNLDPSHVEAGAPTTTLEPVVAWVTAKVPNKKTAAGEDVVIAPLVRSPLDGGELVLLRPNSFVGACVYLAPGEKLSKDHFARLDGAYAEAVTHESVI